MNIWEKWKLKWNVSTNRRMLWIMVIFAITGSSIVWVRKPIQNWLYQEEKFWSLEWHQILIMTVLVYFIYQVHLFVIGSVLGEHKFVKWFLKKMNARILPPFGKK